MGVTAYRYMHRAQEVWSGDTFQGLTAQTDDDGKKHAIQIRRDGAALAVERNARPDVLSPATLDRGFQRDGAVSARPCRRSSCPRHIGTSGRSASRRL